MKFLIYMMRCIGLEPSSGKLQGMALEKEGMQPLLFVRRPTIIKGALLLAKVLAMLLL